MRISYLPKLRKDITNSKKSAPVEWSNTLKGVTRQNFLNYIYSRKIDFNYIRPVSMESILSKKPPKVKIETFEPEHDLDLCGDIDYLGWVGEKAFGIQIKPVTAKANFGNYSATERMRASFADFTSKYGGKVFIVFSLDDEIKNTEVIEQIKLEVERLSV
jgi:hypothetical protein